MAIDIKTLRIGSHVSVDGKRVRVEEVSTLRLNGTPITLIVSHNRLCDGRVSIEDIEPIPLTTELWEELGFEERRIEYSYGLPEVWYVDPEAVQSEKKHSHVVSKVTFYPLGKAGYADWWTIKAIVCDKPMRTGEYTCRYLHEAEAFLALHGVELIPD